MLTFHEGMVAINLLPASGARAGKDFLAYKIKYRPDFSEKEHDLVVLVEHIPPAAYRVQKLLVETKVLQKNPGLVKELTGWRWVAVPVGNEAAEMPDIEHLWQLPGIYIAACKPRAGASPLLEQLETIKSKEILVFYTLKEWWKKNKHLGFSRALQEYKAYLADYYGRIKELKETGKKIDVRVGLVDEMKKIMARHNLPESDPRSWQEAARRMEKPSGVLYEEFPPLGPVGVIDDEFSAYITFHSYDVSSGNLTYISVLIENNDNVVNQFLIWNTGVNDLLEDMDFIRQKLREYGVARRQYDYDLIPMLSVD
ncbi:MAG: hypothetical protein K6T29_00420 [Peptococcaceae bacterium]|nr:hypothetical protein [Peptococcaceae bacterium]